MRPRTATADPLPETSLLHRLCVCWGDLDLASIEILSIIEAHPGVSIKTAAEIAGLDHRTAQLKIALLSRGRGERRPGASARNFVTDARNPWDRRARELELTPAGAEFLEDLRRALQ